MLSSGDPLIPTAELSTNEIRAYYRLSDLLGVQDENTMSILLIGLQNVATSTANYWINNPGADVKIRKDYVKRIFLGIVKEFSQK